MDAAAFHPAVADWFTRQFGRATEAQRRAWPAIQQGRHTLIAAPTGSGKTLAAFLAAIDALVREGLTRGLNDETHVLYVSPLKALSNDVQKNLQLPLAGIRDTLLMHGKPDVNIRAWVRTGDTPPSERERMRRQPPHIVVTTPESLYILLSSESGRRMLATVRSVIVDEIHAVAGNKRGAHLALSLERLAALCPRPPVRIGLSATQKPIEDMAHLLTGAGAAECVIVDTGHVRTRDLALEVPDSPLEAMMANEVWQELYDRLAALVTEHRTTLIFVNTRRLAERAARFLAERLGEEHVTAHHGSLAREHRLDAEERLKGGRLRALVATASLELGIDIGDVDLVCQVGSPRSIAAWLQRVGRSGHSVGGVPKGRLFPLSRDDLVECAALLDAVRRDELDRIRIPIHPIDVLAQQIVAEAANREWEEEALFELYRRAWPYRTLTRDTFTAVTRMLADGFSTRRGRRSAYIHRDAVNGRLRARRGARLTAITNGGAIPDQFDYEVILAPSGAVVGSLNEDFAFESLPGDIFQLGNTSYRILKIEQGKVHVEDARGQPPNIPFWIGEAPGRSDELSHAVSRLRDDLAKQIERGVDAATHWLEGELALPAAAAQQLVAYLATAKAALGVVPTQRQIVFERFFDETGDMHLVIHAPFGSRLNRAWGLALRKRFCRKFNFELQAAATEDSLVLSLGPTHSFPLDEVACYLKSASVREVLVQALLDAPMFPTRWRWNASIALAIQRFRNGRRLPAQFQRSDAEDLIAVVFPDQLACLENVAGQREIPSHPLVDQTLHDCLHETMDIEGLERMLARLEAREIQVLCRDLTGPSPLAQEILNARPYAFLDDAPAEERRTLAVQQRRFLDPQSAADLGRLDPDAVQRVRDEAWPSVTSADELHDALTVLGFLADTEGALWQPYFETLAASGRATALATPTGASLWVAAERLAELRMLHPDATLSPVIAAYQEPGSVISDRTAALRELIRSRLEGLGPVTTAVLAAPLGIAPRQVEGALVALEQEGFVIRGRFTGADEGPQWCERRLLARIHRYTLNRMRSEIAPVSAADFTRFLFHWHHLTGEGRQGEAGLAAVLAQLEGFSAPAAAWEGAILPARVRTYTPDMLDKACHTGLVTWLRLVVRADRAGGAGEGPVPPRRQAGPVRATPIALVARGALPHWRAYTPLADPTSVSPGSSAGAVLEVLRREGACFFTDIVQAARLLPTQAEGALGELVAWGLVSSDGFAGLRTLISANRRRAASVRGRGGRRRGNGLDDAGRWSLLRQGTSPIATATAEDAEHVARVLLRRYGVVFRRLLEREAGLPPWRELLYSLRRLEARGEIRGGRFVDGFSGEQFALPEAVGALRDVRRRAVSGGTVTVSAADPLNLTGIITPGPRVPALPGTRIVYRDAIPVAMLSAGRMQPLVPPAETAAGRRGALTPPPSAAPGRLHTVPWL